MADSTCHVTAGTAGGAAGLGIAQYPAALLISVAGLKRHQPKLIKSGLAGP